MFYRIKGLVRACELAGLTAGPLFTLFGWRWRYRESGMKVQVTAHHIKEYFQEVIAEILEAGQSEAEVRSEMITYNAIGSGNLVVERHQSADGEDIWRLSLELASFSRSKDSADEDMPILNQEKPL